MLFAITLALTLTLPALPNTGPPAPKTENTYEKKAVSSVDYQVNAEVYADVGVIQVTHAVSDAGIATQVVIKKAATADADSPVTDLYLQRPERPMAIVYGYRQRSLPKADIHKIRPPNKV